MMTIAVVLLAGLVPAQEADEGGVRDLLNTQFMGSRADAATQPRSKAREALVGVTIWRLRPSQSADAPGVRLLVHEPDRSVEYTPERVNSDTALREGDRVRMSVESAEAGYLYVVSREKYRDGSCGVPDLIFPTLRLREGNNRVRAGLVVEIPGWDDRPPYWTLRSSRADHAGEVLTLLVTPAPLEGITVGRNAVRLPPEVFDGWMRQWRGRVTAFDERKHAGLPMTEAEKAAAAYGKRLRKNDPLPQTIYRAEREPGKPVLVSTELTLLRLR